MEPKIFYLGIFGLQFIKDYYQTFNQHLQICEAKIFHSRRKHSKLNLGTNKLYLGLWYGMLKNYCDISNQRSPIRLTAKFHTKIRILKFGTKNVLFGWFEQQFWNIIVIFAISALKFASLKTLVQKIEILKFETKNARFPYFRTGIWNYCHILNQRPRICLIIKFGAKIKIFEFGTKNALFGNLKIILS